VVENALDISVRLVDGRELKGELVGSDPNTDVAVIKVAADSTLPTSRLADSDVLKVGDWVLALGSPLGLRFSVTAGIVSAMNRSINVLPNGTGLEAFIQTDAAINPGNSGGPLVDLSGRVVGVNSAIQTETGYYSGAGFAIPINLARKFAADLIRFGEVHRPRLGVSIDDVSGADAEAYRLPMIGGVEIISVTPGEAADRAGVRMGDVVVAINNEPVDATSELLARVAQYQPGETIRLDLIRYGRSLQLTVRLGEFEPAARAERPRAEVARNRLGFTVMALPTRYAARLGRTGQSDIPVITAVDPFSPARPRLQARQAILSLNGEAVTVAELQRVATRFRSGDLISLVVADPGARTPLPEIINYRVR
jgi:serine protease Do